MEKALLFPSGRSVRVLYGAVNKERQFESVLNSYSARLEASFRSCFSKSQPPPPPPTPVFALPFWSTSTPGKAVTLQPLSTLQESELFDFHKEIELGYVVFWISNSLPSKAIILTT
ncbi:hypothetical protein CB1_000654015 [Camelus ferus]|nr:hypothetical protein CB1_000654015 [Camelus ferus]